MPFAIAQLIATMIWAIIFPARTPMPEQIKIFLTTPYYARADGSQEPGETFHIKEMGEGIGTAVSRAHAKARPLPDGRVPVRVEVRLSQKKGSKLLYEGPP
jgi:hypothetical protein